MAANPLPCGLPSLHASVAGVPLGGLIDSLLDLLDHGFKLGHVHDRGPEHTVILDVGIEHPDRSGFGGSIDQQIDCGHVRTGLERPMVISPEAVIGRAEYLAQACVYFFLQCGGHGRTPKPEFQRTTSLDRKLSLSAEAAATQRPEGGQHLTEYERVTPGCWTATRRICV